MREARSRSRAVPHRSQRARRHWRSTGRLVRVPGSIPEDGATGGARTALVIAGIGRVRALGRGRSLQLVGDRFRLVGGSLRIVDSRFRLIRDQLWRGGFGFRRDGLGRRRRRLRRRLGLRRLGLRGRSSGSAAGRARARSAGGAWCSTPGPSGSSPGTTRRGSTRRTRAAPGPSSSARRLPRRASARWRPNPAQSAQHVPCDQSTQNGRAHRAWTRLTEMRPGSHRFLTPGLLS